MEAKIKNSTISLVRGDITEEETDAIVNAANSRLVGGGCVDGAIHRAGGPEIMAECRKIGVCPTGAAVITVAGRLKARKVIHTVGPIYKDGRHQEAELLAEAYSSCLNLALVHGLKSLSFQSISTGAYGYPVEEAAEAALRTIISFLSANKGIDLVRFFLFWDSALKTYA